MKTTNVLLLTLLLSLSVNLQARLYDIEILFFERTDNQYLDAENSLSQFELKEKPMGKLIPEKNPTFLKPAAYSLRKKGFRIIKHLAWRASIKNKRRAPWYQISAGNKLNGLVRISVQRYLHAEFDLVLRQDADGFGQRQYRFKEKRRMRSRKLHYLDHPRMGILIEIRPASRKASPPL